MVYGMRESRDWKRATCIRGLLAALCVPLAIAADPPALKLFDLPRPQLRSIVSERPAVITASATNAPASPVEEIVLQTKVATEIDLLVQRHETMNGSPLLSQRPVARDTSRFQRTLDSLL